MNNGLRNSRPSLLMLAILCYKWQGTLKSASGSARRLLYEELYSLFPDAYGKKKGSKPNVIEKDSVLRRMRDAGWVTITPPLGGRTRMLQVCPAGSRQLRNGLKDDRYHDDLIMVRDYFGGVTPDSEPTPLVEVLASPPDPVEEPVEEMPVIAVAPGWDVEPAQERVGWALLTGSEQWEVVNDDMVALIDAINGCIEVRAIYPLSVSNALPPRN